jgi:hypothetical protein
MILHIGGTPGSPGTTTTRDCLLRSRVARTAAVDWGSDNLLSSPTTETDHDLISSSRGVRRLSEGAEVATHLRCGERRCRGIGLVKDTVAGEVRRAIWSCDCSIGAMKTQCKAAAVLKRHLVLRIFNG